MGIILRQSLKQSIVRYVAVVIGFINVFIYTAFLTKAEYGFFQFCLNTAAMLTPFVMLGSNSLSIRYFPQFKDKDKKNNGFLFLVLIYPFIGLSLFVLVALLFKDKILSYYATIEDTRQFLDYFHYIIYFVILLGFISTFVTYSTNFRRIVVPTIFNNLLVKICVPLAVLLFGYNYISYGGFINGLTLIYLLVLILVVGYVGWLGQLHLRPQGQLINKPLLKEMGSYQGYTMLVGMGGILATRIDLFMVASILGMGYGGVYSIVLIISQVIEIPKNAIGSISGPILAEAWKKNDLRHIEELYKKSSLNQLVAGIFIFIGIWLSIDDLFSILPKGDEYRAGKPVVLILGLAKLIDMGAGVNGLIISYSKFFRFNFYAILLLAGLNIVNNLLLIPIFQLNGAALATLASLLIFNVVKFIYLKKKINQQPFSYKTIWVIAIGIVSYFLVTLIPSVENVFLNIMIKSVTVTIIYGALILYFRVSEDINQFIEGALSKVSK